MTALAAQAAQAILAGDLVPPRTVMAVTGVTAAQAVALVVLPAQAKVEMATAAAAAVAALQMAPYLMRQGQVVIWGGRLELTLTPTTAAAAATATPISGKPETA